MKIARLFQYSPLLSPDEGAGTGGTPETTTTTPPVNDANQSSWEQRFHGAQGRLQQLQEQHKAEKAQLQQQLEAATKSLTAKNADYEGLAAEHETFKGTVTKTTAELEGLKQTMARQKLILEKFPSLMSLELKGLLPVGVGDELEGKLTELASQIKSTADKTVVDQLTGVTTDAKGKEGKRTVEVVQAEMMAAFKANDIPRYNTLREEWGKLPTS